MNKEPRVNFTNDEFEAIVYRRGRDIFDAMLEYLRMVKDGEIEEVERTGYLYDLIYWMMKDFPCRPKDVSQYARAYLLRAFEPYQPDAERKE